MVASSDHTDCICAKEYEPKNDVCVVCASGFVNRFNGNNTCTLAQGFGCVLMTNRVDSIGATMDPEYILATEWAQMFVFPNNILRSEWGQPTEITYLTIESNANGVATVTWFSVCPNWLMLNLGVPQRIGSVETSGCDASEDEDNVAVWVGNTIPRLWSDMSNNECGNNDIVCLDHQYVHYAPDVVHTIASGQTRFLPQRNGSHLVYGQYVFVQSLKPACAIEAYETTSDICGIPSSVNPFSARFYDLQHTNNQTHHYFTTPIAESVQGCTLTECMCGPNHSGRLCSNRVTSIRFEASLDASTLPTGTNPAYRRVLCGETTEESRGVVSGTTGTCECNAFSGTDAHTDHFMGTGCQCVQHNGKTCAGHGTCYSPVMPYGRCSGVSPSKQVRGSTIGVLLFECASKECVFQDESKSHYRIDRGQMINLGSASASEQTIVIQWSGESEECISFVVNGAPKNYYSSAVSIWAVPNESDDVILTEQGAELVCNTRNGTLKNWNEWVETLNDINTGDCTTQEKYWGLDCTVEIDEWACTNQTDGWNCVAPPQAFKCERSVNEATTSVTGIIDLESIANCSDQTIEPNWTITIGFPSFNQSLDSVPNTTTRTRSDDPVWKTLPALVEGTLNRVDQFGYQRGRFDCSDPVDRIFAAAYMLNHTQDTKFYDGNLCPHDDEHTFWNVSSIGKFFGLFDTNHPYHSFDQPVEQWGDGQFSLIKSILNNKWMIDLDPLVERPHFWEEYLTTSWADETQWEDIRRHLLKKDSPVFPFNHAFESLLVDQIEEKKTSRISHSIPGTRRYFMLDQFPLQSQLIQRRLHEFWASSLAPVACTNDWQCASFGLGTCVYAGRNQNQYRSWQNGVPEWYDERRIHAVGDEGGCACHQSGLDGYWDPEWHCQRCRDGYGPKTEDEWSGLVRYNATLPGNFSLLDDTDFKACAWPWAVDPILASDNPRSICSGHGKFVPDTISWDSNFTKPREVIMTNQWKPLDDPSICLVFNLTGFPNLTGLLVFLQQNWVLNQPWYTNDESRSIAYFLGKPVNNTRVDGYWIHANATCHQYNHV